MSRPKTVRNKLIYKMRSEDGLTFKELGILFNLDRTTVKDICFREQRKTKHSPQPYLEPQKNRRVVNLSPFKCSMFDKKINE